MITTARVAPQRARIRSFPPPCVTVVNTRPGPYHGSLAGLAVRFSGPPTPSFRTEHRSDWLRRRDSNPRPAGYGPAELPTAPPRDCAPRRRQSRRRDQAVEASEFMKSGAGGGIEPWACASPSHLPPEAAVLPLNYCRHRVSNGIRRRFWLRKGDLNPPTSRL